MNIPKKKINQHRPHHIYDGYDYFLTARTYNKIDHFNTEQKKKIFIKRLKYLSEYHHIDIFAWVLLDNHYHLLFRLNNTHTNEHKVLAEFIKKLHSQTTSILNQIEYKKGRKVWYQYRDRCLKNKADFWRHFNYIYQNPYKHKCVQTLDECKSYKFSSNSTWHKRFGDDGIAESFTKYPIRDWCPI